MDAVETAELVEVLKQIRNELEHISWRLNTSKVQAFFPFTSKYEANTVLDSQ